MNVMHGIAHGIAPVVIANVTAGHVLVASGGLTRYPMSGVWRSPEAWFEHRSWTTGRAT
jgi:hypothetical protein